MKKVILLLMLALVLCALGLTACGSSEPAEEDTSAAKVDLSTAEDSPEWITTLEQAKDAKQLFVVAAVGKTTAYVSMHQKDDDGNWKVITTVPGYIGRNGLGKTKEGDWKTPVGTYHFNAAFGINDDPGCAIKYQKVTDDDYWSGDPREGYHYNQMVSLKDLPDLSVDDSEHIVDYPYHYQYCMNVSYNEDCTPGKGSAIFLHCLGPMKPFTGGCIAVPKENMITIMQNVDPDCVVVIDSLKKLSPETWEEWDPDNTQVQ